MQKPPSKFFVSMGDHIVMSEVIKAAKIVVGVGDVIPISPLASVVVPRIVDDNAVIL